MSNFTMFMKKNKTPRTPTTYAATKSLKDENGEPLLWTIRPISSREVENIREECMNVDMAKGKTRFDSRKFTSRLLCAAIAEPNLNNAELQESYGVMDAENLLYEMVDDPAEFTALLNFVQNYSGFKGDLQANIDEAKNS